MMFLATLIGAATMIGGFGYGFSALLSRIERRDGTESFIAAFARVNRRERIWGVALATLGSLVGIIGLKIFAESIPGVWLTLIFGVGIAAALLVWTIRHRTTPAARATAVRRLQWLACAGSVFIGGWLFFSIIR